ncbi:HEAT repeat-containing protein [Caenorhabditis elegans]|uniref:HEAT repeat-containing protein n=1 Tax=Caenorhabditis elegans TaxID=6239 RepID=Q7YWN2_CAEEL|nr:HEAT repeat-containing protein [Caenorhabditis elegans]CAE18042.1 HEAT repeat-containing protein [Caenorhabditis elegans]|eukprot:NP_001022462.1 Uncharacterized protein CELE_Y53C12A.7 [Caenorhabditis elegans]
MKVPEEIQTEMMADMLREKMKNHKKSKPSGKKKEKNEQIVAKADKPTSVQNPARTLVQIQEILAENSNNDDLSKSMDLLIPVMLGMLFCSPHPKVRDQAIECLRTIDQKMGKSIIEKHVKRMSNEKRTVIASLI